jgi:hypothetical protein
MARKPETSGYIAKLKVTLQGIEPPVWRLLLIPANMTLFDLHNVIQTVMPWTDNHLHEFNVAGERFGDPSRSGKVVSDARLTLAGVRNKGARRFSYTYDFGDSWEHLIVIEGTVPRVEGQHYPACIAGECACPPEDCGGTYGYADLLEAWADPTHPDHERMAEWLDDDFDPEAFSVADIDARLAARFGPAKPAKHPAKR